MMMVRTLANSIVLAIGIAVALSFLPSVDMMSNGEVSVFQRDNPTALSEETIVDFLSLQQSRFDYRHVKWDAQNLTLQVDFTADGNPAKAVIAEDWLRFTQGVFQSTSNVATLLCQLYSSKDGELLAVLKVGHDDFKKQDLKKDIKQEQAAEYLDRHFDFQVP